MSTSLSLRQVVTKAISITKLASQKSTAHSLGWAGYTPDEERLYVSASTLHSKISLWKNLSEIVKGFGVLKNNTWIFEGMSNEQDINHMV